MYATSVGAFSLWSKIFPMQLIKTFKLSPNESADYKLYSSVCYHLRAVMVGLCDQIKIASKN